MFLGLSVRSFCDVAARIVQLGGQGQCHWGGLVPWGGEGAKPDLPGCLDGCFLSTGIRMRALVQSKRDGPYVSCGDWRMLVFSHRGAFVQEKKISLTCTQVRVWPLISALVSLNVD